MNIRPAVLALLLATSCAHAQAPTAGTAVPVAGGHNVPLEGSSMAGLWSSLRRTPDQRGQVLLEQGKPAAAAATFADPRRKAYASLQARDYAGAASALAPFNDSEAHYNRGNALAHTGDLPGALAAYDSALKNDPQHRDARHNRDLVAKALAEQKKQQDKQNQRDQPGKTDERQPQQSPSSAEPQKEDEKGGTSEPQSNAPQADPKDGNRQGSADKPDKKSLGQPRPSNPSKEAESQPPDAPDDATSARRDADAVMNPTQPGQPPTAKPGSGADTAGKAAAVPQPMNEQQLAQDQWLRSIPDDPGGLLRRKFLIEHLMRQREAKP